MEALVVSEPSLVPLYKQAWTIPTSPKIKHFIWCCLTNSLSTGANMQRNKLSVFACQRCGASVFAECQRCGAEVEDINHILFTCPYARLCWAVSPLCSVFYPKASDSLYANLSDCMNISSQLPANDIWPWLLWRIWESRNVFCINQVDGDAQDLVRLALDDAEAAHKVTIVIDIPMMWEILVFIYILHSPDWHYQTTLLIPLFLYGVLFAADNGFLRLGLALKVQVQVLHSTEDISAKRIVNWYVVESICWFFDRVFCKTIPQWIYLMGFNSYSTNAFLTFCQAQQQEWNQRVNYYLGLLPYVRIEKPKSKWRIEI